MLEKQDLQAIREIIREEMNPVKEKLDKIMYMTHADVLDKLDARIWAIEEKIKAMTE